MVVKYEKIKSYSPLHRDADESGMVVEWVGRNEWGNAVAFGRTKKECIEDAKRQKGGRNDGA